MEAGLPRFVRKIEKYKALLFLIHNIVKNVAQICCAETEIDNYNFVQMHQLNETGWPKWVEHSIQDNTTRYC